MIGETLGLEPGRREIVAYGLLVLAGNLIGLAAVLVAAHFLGALSATAAIVVTLVLLRPSAGGAHCGSTFNCNLLSFLLILPFGLGAASLAAGPLEAQFYFLVPAFLVLLAGICINAPYLTTVKPRAEARRRQLKARALALAMMLFAAALWLIHIGHTAWGAGMAAGLLFQGIMLLPPGIYFVKIFDLLINNLATRMGGEPR